MTYLYKINFRGIYQYIEDETKRKYFINTELNIVADNIEEAREKIINNYWKYIDGIQSKNEIILSDVRMTNAIKEAYIDIE